MNSSAVENNIGNDPDIHLENKKAKNFDFIGCGLDCSPSTITIEDTAFFVGPNTKNNPTMSIDNFIASIKNSPYNQKLYEEKDIVISGKLFKRIIRGNPSDPMDYFYLINYPDSSLFVSIITPVRNTELNTGEKIDNVKITEEVLKTFTFLK